MTARAVIVDILYAYVVVLFVRIMLTWFPINPWSRMARVERAFGAVTDPVLRPVRKILPPLRVGSMGLDLSPMAVMFALLIIIAIVSNA